jgi:thiol-disulfide isomerase/thioredoxin
MNRQIVVGLFLVTQMVVITHGANQTSKEQKPDPLDLLKRVAQARQMITSGEMELAVTSHYFPRPLDGTTQTRLKAAFDGGKRRFESFGREYSYVLMGRDAAEVTDAKRTELGLDREAAVREGLLSSFEAHDVTTYDGTILLHYRETNGKPESTTITDPGEGSFTYVFDPRCLGLRPFLSAETSIENCLAYDSAKAISLVGRESVEGTDCWHVSVESRYGGSLEFWIDATHPHRVVRQSDGLSIAVSKYDETHLADPIPIEVKITETQDGKPLLEKRFIRSNTRINEPMDPASWTLAGLKMKVGTDVIDSRISRSIGYWDGTGLSKDRPSMATPVKPTPARESSPGKLLALLEKDPKSAFAVEASTWIILNTPDGPDVEKAAQVILREHPRSPNLTYLCQGLTRLRHRCATELLQTILDHNPAIEVQAHACFALATLLKLQANETGSERKAIDAERLFERVLANYPQVESKGAKLEELAKPQLFELRHFGVGRVAPEIQGEDLNGGKIKLSDFRGKVVVLTFWGTWCGPCMRLVPDERKLVERMAGKPFALIGVNSDKDEVKLKKAVADEKITWPSFRDGAPPGPIAKAWNVRSWPAVYVLDPQGVIRYRDVHGQSLADAVDALISERK